MTPVRSSMAEVLLCLKRDSSDGMDSSSSEVSEDRTDESHVSQALMEKVENLAEDIACNCKKSKCLKLYCQCFAGQIVCNPLLCKCTRCANTPAHGAEREEAVKMILERNPAAFDSKFKREASDDGTKTAHKTGCRCRKSMCLKKYCECFHAGVPCSASCTCLQCSNQGVPPASTSTSLVAIPARQSTTNPSTVVSTATKRSPPLDSTPEAAAVMRAAQDLALLRNKDGTRITTATATPTTKSTPIHSQRLSCSPLSFMTAHVDTTKPTEGSNNFAQTSSLGHMMTPIDDNESNSIRKRVRSDSPVNEHGNSTGNDRPPSILSRGGATSGRQKSPPLSSSSVSSKTTTRLLVRPSSQAQPPADVSFCDLGMLAGGRFKRQAPPTLRISSASPNSLYCASALSLLSGRDMSPQTPGTSSTVKHYLSTGSFFATSPAPYQGASTDKSSNESNEKKRKTASGETTQDFELSDALHRSGSGVRRPHSSSMDNTSEEDSTSISDSPYSRDLPPPTGSAIPPMIVLPPDSADSSKLRPHEAFSSEGMYSSNTNNSNMSHFQKGVEYFNDGNWTKPVVDVLGNMS